MAHPDNWLPAMGSDETAWLDKCPESVLFAIAQQLAMQAIGEEDFGKVFQRMQEEWAALHGNGIVPQKPFDPRGERRKREARAQQPARKAWSRRRFWARMALGPQGRRDEFFDSYGMTPEQAMEVPAPDAAADRQERAA